MNILLTGARAPIAADIVRALVSAGHQVWTADSLRFPVGRFAPGARGYVRIPPPRQDFIGFSRRLVAACWQLGIERIIPTSEEVFWLAAVDLPAGCEGFFPSQAVLGQLHNKATFAELAQSLGYGAGHSEVLRTRAELEAFAREYQIDQYVLKPVYSRFASEVVIHPTPAGIAHIQPSGDTPWLVQRRAVGREVCTYNIAVNGELVLHAAYQPRFRAGKGAGIYFQPVASGALRDMAADFAKATGATGQLSFDVIEDKRNLVALECNPRGTSGAHLAAQNLRRFGKALVGQEAAGAELFYPTMLTLPMMVYHPGIFLHRNGRQAWAAAEDAMSAAKVPLWAQGLAMAEVLARSAAAGKGALAGSTHDIEWNGEAIGG